MSKANKYLVYHDILLEMANSAEYKGSLTEEALLAGAARLMSRYEEEKEEELKDELRFNFGSFGRVGSLCSKSLD